MSLSDSTSLSLPDDSSISNGKTFSDSGSTGFGDECEDSQFFLITTQIFDSPSTNVLTILQSAIKTLLPARRRQKNFETNFLSSSLAKSYVIDFSLERRNNSTAECSGRPRCLDEKSDVLNWESCWNRPASNWAKVASTKDEDGTVHALRVDNTDDNKIRSTHKVKRFCQSGLSASVHLAI